MKRILIAELTKHIGEEVRIAGWVSVRRDQGKMIFLDFRDASGVVQGVILPGSEALETGKVLREEFVVGVTGRVNERPERNRKEGVQNGSIELEILQVEILNTSETIPFEIAGDTREINELTRLEHRYIDLRSERMQQNIRRRGEMQKFLRDVLTEKGYLEIETPLLSATTPEGSRSYVVPSRNIPGSFYSLPQSPQQYLHYHLQN
jgi:aspartyl-tRNA synthetase